MNLKDLINTINNIRKGTYQKATWQSEKVVNGITYTKVSNGVVRLVKYENINGVVVNNNKPKNTNEIVELEHFIKTNTNTNNTYVLLGTTNHKSKSNYYANGVEIDKSQYESVIKPTVRQKSVVFRVLIQNLLKLGN